MNETHERFMRLALDEARRAQSEGNMAVGSVVVRDVEVLERAHNEVNSTFDATAHAETVAIRKLTTRLKALNPSYRAGHGPLADCILYTTVEPCAMCAHAICVAGMAQVVIGARFARMRVDRGEYTIERLFALTGQQVTVISGILYEECADLRLSYTGDGRI